MLIIIYLTGIYRDDRNCIYKPSANGYFCKETGHTTLTLETMDADSSHSPPVLVTSTFVATFSDSVSQTSCCASELSSIFYSVLPSNKPSKICFAGPVPWSLRLYPNSGHNATRILLGIFYDKPRIFHVFVKGNYIPPSLFFFKHTLENTMTGTNYFSFQENLLYVAILRDEPVEIYTYNSLHVAFIKEEISGEETLALVIQRLAVFLQIGHDQIRIVHNSFGSESSLKAIADNATKRKYQCPSLNSCLFTQHKNDEQKTVMGSITSESLQPCHSVMDSRMLIMEISDPPYFLKYKHISSFSSDRLNQLATTLINAQQIGELQRALELPIDSLVVTVSANSVPAEENSR